MSIDMTEPLRISWEPPSERRLPVGTKVKRDTGLVAELLEEGRLMWTRSGWLLTSSDGWGQRGVWLNAGGERMLASPAEHWYIETVGIRDDELLWTLPRRGCELPPGIQVRVNGAVPTLLEHAVLEERGRFRHAVRMSEDGGRTVAHLWFVNEVGFPRPRPYDVFRHEQQCELCGTRLSGFNACMRCVGGSVGYSVCSDCRPPGGEAGFLAAVKASRKQERQRTAEDQVREIARVREMMCGDQTRPGARFVDEVLGQWNEPTGWGVFSEAIEKQEEFSRVVLGGVSAPLKQIGMRVKTAPAPAKPSVPTASQMRAAKVAKLGEMLRQPMAPRFSEDTKGSKR